MDLSIEELAEIAASIEAVGSREAVLEARGLTLERWLAAQRSWFSRMDEQARARRFDLARRYGKVYVEALSRPRHALRPSTPAPMPRLATRREADEASTTPVAPPTSAPRAPHPGPRSAPTPVLGGLTRDRRLDLADYASLCAEIAVLPQRADEMLSRRGLVEADLAREHAAWQRAFAAETKTYEQYLSIFRRHRDYLAGASGEPPSSRSAGRLGKTG